MSVTEITKEGLDKINDKEFTVLLIYANGCHHCEAAKPLFDKYSANYPNIQFLKGNINDLHEHYGLFAEKTQEVIYEAVEGSTTGETNAIPQFNEDGTPKMMINYRIPTFMVYHTKASDEANPFGYVGAFDGANESEMASVLDQLANFK